jgi:hypothetical protein
MYLTHPLFIASRSSIVAPRNISICCGQSKPQSVLLPVLYESGQCMHDGKHILIIDRVELIMLSKAIKCWFYTNTSHIPSPDASHSRTKGCVKSRSVNTRKVHMTFFILLNSTYASSNHRNSPFLGTYVNGTYNCESPFTKRL